MRFQCPGCRSTFSVPDEKIPDGKEIRILCPKCRTPVERKDGVTVMNEEEKVEAHTVLLALDAEGAQEDASFVEVVEEGAKLALLCISSAYRAQKITEIVRTLDFYVSQAQTTKVALNKLHHNSYDLVVLDDSFDGSKGSENLVLHYINLLPMHMRRQFFLCLMSESLATMDQLLAFRLGVNMILNAKDMDRAKVMLTRAFKEHQFFYKVFNEELKRKGQL